MIRIENTTKIAEIALQKGSHIADKDRFQVEKMQKAECKPQKPQESIWLYPRLYTGQKDGSGHLEMTSTLLLPLGRASFSTVFVP